MNSELYGYYSISIMRLESPVDFDYSENGVFSPDARIPSHRSVLNVHKFKKLKRGPINL